MIYFLNISKISLVDDEDHIDLLYLMALKMLKLCCRF
jgi:hypothetical protein